MKHTVVFAFLLMVLGVNAQDLNDCTKWADNYRLINPDGTCAYDEDAVRCGIKSLDLLNDNVSNETIQTGRTWANDLLTDHQCDKNFDDIFDEVKAAPHLLKLQDCIDAPGATTPNSRSDLCNQVEEAVKCAILEIALYKENASDSDMQFLRETAARYLTPISCQKTFDDLLAEAKEEKAVEPCAALAQYMGALNPGSTCAYIEDAVRCAINALDLYGENAEADQEYVTAADKTLSEYNCSKRFEAIFSETTTSPQLLKLQQCFATALEKGLENLMEACTYVEEAVTCGIDAFELHEEKASNETLQFGREMATRYLNPFNCNKTFDEILTNITTNNNNNNNNNNNGGGGGNTGSTVSPTGWLAAVLVGFMVKFTAMF